MDHLAWLTRAQHPTPLAPVNALHFQHQEVLSSSGGWQVMDKESLEKLKAGEWGVEHPAEKWQPRLNEASSPALEAAYLDLDL